MPEEPEKPQKKTLDELEKELKDDELKPEIVEVESITDDDIPDPRARGTSSPVASASASEEQLREAASATEDDADDDAVPTDRSLHIEKPPAKEAAPFWKRKKFWLLTVAVLFVLLVLAWLIRPSRLFMVNLLGLKATVYVVTSTQADDVQTNALLKNVTVEFNGQAVQTDDQGRAESQQPYGSVLLVAKKSGYDPVMQDVLLDFDPFFYLLGGRQQDEDNRNVNLQLKAVGTAMRFGVRDYLTDGPLTFGTFSVGDVVAEPDDNGVVSLRIPATEAKTIKVKSNFGGAYVDKEIELPIGSAAEPVYFVPTGKAFYLSKRSGATAVYGSNLDGGAQDEVVKASSGETAAMNFTSNLDGTFGALASTRDGKRDEQGTLLQRLYIVDIAAKKLSSVDEAQWFSFVDWSGNTLVYVAGERKPGEPSLMQRLAAIDVTTGDKKDLAEAASFSGVRVALGSALYLRNVAAGEDGASSNPELRTVPIKGGTEKTLGTSVKQLSQPDFDRFAYQTGDGAWHEYNVNTAKVANAAAPSSASRAMVANTSADGQTRLVVDVVDGKVELIAKTVATGQEKTLHNAAGIRGPIRWAGNSVVFRVSDGMQTADYVVSPAGGQPKKVSDVTQPSNPMTLLTGFISLFY